MTNNLSEERKTVNMYFDTGALLISFILLCVIAPVLHLRTGGVEWVPADIGMFIWILIELRKW